MEERLESVMGWVDLEVQEAQHSVRELACLAVLGEALAQPGTEAEQVEAALATNVTAVQEVQAPHSQMARALVWMAVYPDSRVSLHCMRH